MLPARKLPEPSPGGAPTPGPSAPGAPAKPLRLLLVAHNLGEEARAGTENYVIHLGRTLAHLGVSVAFLAPQGPPTSGPQEMIPWRSSRLGDLDFLQFGRVNQDFAGLTRHPGFEAAFREILGQHPVDLVHFHHTYLSSISLLEVALDLRLPVVLTLHDAWHLCPRLHCVNDQNFCGGPEAPKTCRGAPSASGPGSIRPPRPPSSNFPASWFSAGSMCNACFPAAVCWPRPASCGTCTTALGWRRARSSICPWAWTISGRLLRPPRQHPLALFFWETWYR